LLDNGIPRATFDNYFLIFQFLYLFLVYTKNDYAISIFMSLIILWHTLTKRVFSYTILTMYVSSVMWP